MRHFWKYTGLGNDFILFDATKENLTLSVPRVRWLCDRRLGVGADGVLVLSESPSADARLQVFNADGSEAEMCGNGLRCVVRFMDEVKGVRKPEISIETGAGLRRCHLEWTDDARCSVIAEMGHPSLSIGEIPMDCAAFPGLASNESFIRRQFAASGQTLTGTALSMGNPHLVLFDFPFKEFEALAPHIERHPAFPNRTNVECAHRLSPGVFEVIVWERGCGFTQACGTGACAVAVAALIEGREKPGVEMEIRLPGGSLFVQIERDGDVWLRGEAHCIFEGNLCNGDGMDRVKGMNEGAAPCSEKRA